MPRRTFAFGCLLLAACANDDYANVANQDMNAVALPDAQPVNAAKPETKAQRQARLREKARTDPEGADAEAIQHMSRDEVIASAINSAGFLCAKVTSAAPAGDGKIRAECIEYRSGEGRVSYTIDAAAGTVEQR